MKVCRVLAVAVAATAVASGCSRPIPAVPEAVVPTSSMTSTPKYSPHPRPHTSRPQPSTSPQRVTSVGGGGTALICEHGEKIAMGFDDVQAALGARVTRLMIRNCGTSTLTLPVMPKLQQATEVGKSVPVAWRPYDSRTASRRLAPGKVSGWELSWHTNGDCEHRGARRLVATVGTTTAVMEGCLDLGDAHALTDESSTGPDGSDAIPIPQGTVRFLD